MNEFYDEIKSSDENDINTENIIIPDIDTDNADDEEAVYADQHIDFSDLRIDEFDEDGDDEKEIDVTDEEPEEIREGIDPKKKALEKLKAQRKLREKYREEQKRQDKDTEENSIKFSDLRLNTKENGPANDSINEGIDINTLEDEFRESLINAAQVGSEKSVSSADFKPEWLGNTEIATENATFIKDNTADSFNSYELLQRKAAEADKDNENQGQDTLEDIKEPVFKDYTEQSYEKEFDGINAEDTESTENFSTYDFSRVAGNLAKGLSANVVSLTFSGITGDYSVGTRDVALALTDTFAAVAASALSSIEKLSYNAKMKAAETLEEIRAKEEFKDFSLDKFGKDTRSEITERLTGSGFKKADIDNLYKHKRVAEDELSMKQLIMGKVNADKSEVPEELKNYILKKGFKNLSARSELNLVDILNKENSNAEVRNLRLSSLSYNKLFTLKKKLLAENRLNDKSAMLIKKAMEAKKRGIFERKDVGLSLKRVYERIHVSRQDLFTKTVKGMTESAKNTKNNIKFTLLGTQTIYAFAKRSYKSGKTLIRQRTDSVRMSEFRLSGKNISRNNMSRIQGMASAANKMSIASSLGRAATGSVLVSESSDEEKEKKEKRQEFVNKVVESKRITERINNRLYDKGFKKQAGNAFKNTSKGTFKQTAKKATVKNTAKAKAAADAKSASYAGKIGKTLLSFLAKIPLPVWVIIIATVIIMLLLHFFTAFAESPIGLSIEDASNTLSNEVSKGAGIFTEAMNEVNETTILVSNRLTDDEKYVDIKEYLEILQKLDEKREENAIKFAEAPINSVSPESLGLLPYQKNGRTGQNPEVLCGKCITHYGSFDKKNAYTLHYMDAYGNEIANHSTNARDVLSLCSVIFSNYADEKGVFKFLLEDEWYLLNPKIEWQESEVYCCEVSSAHMEGNTAYYTSCTGNTESGSKYEASSDHFWYYCNKYEDTNRVKNYKDAGVKLTGEIKGYDAKGCKKRTISTDFEGDGYDTYDLYLDGFISYDDYLYYVDTYSDEYIITGTFYKEEWYCSGHFVNCCFGHKDIDIYITLYDKDYAIANNIYPDESLSHSGKYGRYEDFLDLFIEDGAFENEGRIRWVDKIYENDWFDTYGIDVFGGVGFEIGGSLTDADIDSILGHLSDQNLSIIQQAIIEFALRYVGRIPYYFGGKAEYLDYEKNHFYSVVEPDYKGRTRKGLDCSGFVSWVFANKGISIPQSTAGFSGYATTRSHSSLKVGDLGFLNKPGAENNHIGIYAGVDENGNDLWIHCNASAGNVSVNNYNGFKYYVSLTN